MSGGGGGGGGGCTTVAAFSLQTKQKNITIAVPNRLRGMSPQRRPRPTRSRLYNSREPYLPGNLGAAARRRDEPFRARALAEPALQRTDNGPAAWGFFFTHYAVCRLGRRASQDARRGTRPTRSWRRDS